MAEEPGGERRCPGGGGLRWLPFLLWGAVWIGLLGGESFASRHTTAWVARLLPFLPAALVPAADFVLRKILHFAAYGLLGWLAGREAAARLAPAGWRKRFWALGALLLAVALVDEGHQELVRGRHPSPLDVLVDLAGAAVGLALSLRAARTGSRREGDR
jgi:VanZ family protein